MAKYYGKIGFAETAEPRLVFGKRRFGMKETTKQKVILFEQSEALMKINTPLSDIRDKAGDYICLEIVDLDKED